MGILSVCGSITLHNKREEIIPLTRGTVKYYAEEFTDMKRPRIVIATSLAFTRLTIDKCDIVISSGIERVSLLNNVTNLIELANRPSTARREEQRFGRCGINTYKGTVEWERRAAGGHSFGQLVSPRRGCLPTPASSKDHKWLLRC